MDVGLKEIMFIFIAYLIGCFQEDYSSPAIITYSLPKRINSKKFGEIMERKGYLLSYKSSYLIRRNWIQVCVMGALKTDCLDNFHQAVEESLVEADREAS